MQRRTSPSTRSPASSADPAPTLPRIQIAYAEQEECLALWLSNDTWCDVLELTLAQARALSLELIRQAYQAEVRKLCGAPAHDAPAWGDLPRLGHALAFQFQHRPSV